METTAYTVLITYHLYDGNTLEQLVLRLSAYSEQEAKQEASKIADLMPNIQASVINVMAGYISL